jgi:hypothetical protein
VWSAHIPKFDGFYSAEFPLLVITIINGYLFSEESVDAAAKHEEKRQERAHAAAGDKEESPKPQDAKVVPPAKHDKDKPAVTADGDSDQEGGDYDGGDQSDAAEPSGDTTDGDDSAASGTPDSEEDDEQSHSSAEEDAEEAERLEKARKKALRIARQKGY